MRKSVHNEIPRVSSQQGMAIDYTEMAENPRATLPFCQWNLYDVGQPLPRRLDLLLLALSISRVFKVRTCTFSLRKSGRAKTRPARPLAIWVWHILIMMCELITQSVASRKTEAYTHEQMSEFLQQQSYGERGFSAQSVRRFCSEHNIHYRSNRS